MNRVFLAAAVLLFAVSAAGQEYSVDFRDNPISTGERYDVRAAVLILTGTSPAGHSQTVDYTYTIGDAVRSGQTYFWVGSRRAEILLYAPDDDIYTGGATGTITISYYHPYLEQVIEKSAAISVEDDERPPHPTFDDARVLESEPGGIHAVRFSLPHRSAFPVTANVGACCGSATAGVDYELIDTSYTFAPMQTEGEVRLRVFDDGVAEGVETFEIYIPSVGRSATVTIVEEDLQAAMTPSAPRVITGEFFDLDFSLPGSATGPFAVSVEIADESILRGVDPLDFQLGAKGKTVRFKAGLPGTTTMTVTVGSILFAPSIYAIEVYDAGFDIDPVPVMRPGEEVTSIVRMSPAGEAIALTADASPRGIIEVSADVPVSAGGTGEITIKALKSGVAEISLTSPAGRFLAFREVRVESAVGITAVAPSTGPSTGGTPVIITGTAFTSQCSVKFGEKAAAAIAFVNDTTLRAISPSHAPSLVPVSVTCGGATAVKAAAFTFTPVRSRAVRH